MDSHLAPVPPAHRWWMLAVLCLSVLLVTIDNTIVNVGLPTISRELFATTSQLQWVVDAYTLVFAGLLLVGGHLGDRLGRLRMLQLGLVLFGITSAASAAAQTTGQLIGGRAAMGAGAALIFPATLAMLSNIFTSPRERATAIGIWSGVSGLAVAIGPVTGGLLLEHFTWSAIFLVNVPVVIIALVAGRMILPESRDSDPGRFDAVGAVGAVAGVGLLVWTVIEAPNHGWTSVTTIAGFVVASLLIGGFVAWEARRSHPLFDVRLFSTPRFAAGAGAITAAFFGLFGFIFMVTQYFQAVRGYGTLQAGVATLPFAIVTGTLSPVAIVLMKRFGSRLVVASGLLLMTSGFVVAAGTSLESQYWGRIVTAMVLMAAGLALTTGPATDSVMGALPRSKAGAGSAVNDTTREIGGTLGVAVVGSALTSVYGSHVADALRGLALPEGVVSVAKDSIIAAGQVVAGLPASVQAAAGTGVRQAFIDGVSAGSWVAAVATTVGAVAVILFLPARADDPTAAKDSISLTASGSGPDSLSDPDEAAVVSLP